MSNTRKTTVLITGCTPGGIGHALAVEFRNRGCHVIATARSEAMLQDLAKQGFQAEQLDVTDQESIAACKERVDKSAGGKLDILINNAGRTHTIPALDAEIDDVRQTYETNVFGPIFVVKAFIPLLIQARGLIINISSISTQVPYLFGSIYSSTKGAIDVWSRCLRLELKPLGVRVMVAMTGTVRSNIASRQHRTLPADSYYQPIRDVFERRLTFSQNNGTMSTEVYAKKLVTDALRGEGWFGGWLFGTPDWFWFGGLSGLVYYISGFLPRSVGEAALGIYWGVSSMRKRLSASLARKQD